jgi:serine protease AprX
VNKKQWVLWLSLAALVVSMIGASASIAVTQSFKVHPGLLDLARRSPNQSVEVIVQKTDKTNAAESLVEKLGGKVTIRLTIINAFVANIFAGSIEKLAAHESVKWVSPDAPMVGTSDGLPPAPVPISSVEAQPITQTQNGNFLTWTSPDAPPIDKGDGTMKVDPVQTDEGMLVNVRDLNVLKRAQTYDYTSDTSNLISAYNRTIRAVEVWNQAPKYLKGEGIGVAVVDSGIDNHPDLDQSIVVDVRYNTTKSKAGDDKFGHGTHIAGVIGGNGEDSKGQYVGVAPGVDLINVKVSDDDGSAQVSGVVAGLQWILDNKEKYKIRVVNISLNASQAESYHTSPLCAAVEVLWFNGIVVVISAGNNGGGNLYPPANDPFVVTVGAVDDKGTPRIDDDTILNFSGYGVDDGVSKPDLVAPGRHIVSTLGDSLNRKEHPKNAINKRYFRMSGTSVAAPMVSGAVALLLQDEPNLTPDQVKYRLKATARPFISAEKTGAGYLDVYAAVNGTTNQSANTGLPISRLINSGNGTAWNSVSWSSVSWSSVSWSSVSWSSVSWSSDHWE